MPASLGPTPTARAGCQRTRCLSGRSRVAQCVSTWMAWRRATLWPRTTTLRRQHRNEFLQLGFGELGAGVVRVFEQRDGGHEHGVPHSASRCEWLERGCGRGIRLGHQEVKLRLRLFAPRHAHGRMVRSWQADGEWQSWSVATAVIVPCRARLSTGISGGLRRFTQCFNYRPVVRALPRLMGMTSAPSRSLSR
jgi:hypothetical protein